MDRGPRRRGAHDRVRSVSLIAILLALIGACSYGAGDFLGGIATRRASWLPVTIMAELVGLIPLGVVAFILTASVTTADMAWGAAAGVIGGAGIAFLYYGLGTGTMSIVAPISAVCATALPVLAGAVAGERLSTQALAGVAIAVASIVLISQAHPGTAVGKTPVRGSILTGLASGLCIAAFLILMARAHSGGLWPLFGSRVVATAELALLALVTRRPSGPPRQLWTTTAWCGVFDAGGTVFFVLAAHRGTLGIAATLISLYPVSTLILARLMLGERLRRRQMLGLAAATAAVVLITTAAT